MNNKQQAWIDKHTSELRTYLESSPMTDHVATAAVGYADVVVALAKGNKKVREAMFEVLEEFDKRRRPK